MNTEQAVQQFWATSLAWRGRGELSKPLTTERLFNLLRPLEIHRSLPLQRQSRELSTMIVKFKRTRCPKPRRKLTNLIQFPTHATQNTKAA